MKYLLAAVLFMLSMSVNAQQFTKADKKKVLTELKKYKKNPQSYQRMIDDYKTTIDSDQIAIKNWRDEALTAATKQVELEQKMAALSMDLAACQNKPAPECPKAGTVPTKGVIYKVQMGLFDKFNINNYFNEVKVITPEEVEGMNRYVVSYFTDEETARNFVKDLRKLGLKDAFAAKYEDGQRVYEWDKNEKMKGRRAPASLRELVTEKPIAHPHQAPVAEKKTENKPAAKSQPASEKKKVSVR